MKYEFDRMTTEGANVTEEKENFIEMYDGTLIGKEPIILDLEDKDVEVRLFIRDIDMAEFDDCTGHIIEIGVVPTLNSLSKQNQESILNQFRPEDEYFEAFKSDKMCSIQEVLDYGYGLTLRSETVEDLDQLEYKMNSAIVCSFTVRGLLGFELDRYMNRIGNTGWDFLSDYCEDKDLLQMALARYDS